MFSTSVAKPLYFAPVASILFATSPQLPYWPWLSSTPTQKHGISLYVFCFLNYISRPPLTRSSLISVSPSGLHHLEPYRSYGQVHLCDRFPRRPYTPPHSVYPAALMSLSAGEMSSDSTSGRTSRGSGSHSPNLSSVPHSVRYNPISVSSVVRSGRERQALFEQA
jgi:hypothetical protein